MLFKEISFTDFTIDKLIEIGKRTKNSDINLSEGKLLLFIIIL